MSDRVRVGAGVMSREPAKLSGWVLYKYMYICDIVDSTCRAIKHSDYMYIAERRDPILWDTNCGRVAFTSSNARNSQDDSRSLKPRRAVSTLKLSEVSKSLKNLTESHLQLSFIQNSHNHGPRKEEAETV
jgi:hypothetical protein